MVAAQKELIVSDLQGEETPEEIILRLNRSGCQRRRNYLEVEPLKMSKKKKTLEEIILRMNRSRCQRKSLFKETGDHHSTCNKKSSLEARPLKDFEAVP